MRYISAQYIAKFSVAGREGGESDSFFEIFWLGWLLFQLGYQYSLLVAINALLARQKSFSYFVVFYSIRTANLQPANLNRCLKRTVTKSVIIGEKSTEQPQKGGEKQCAAQIATAKQLTALIQCVVNLFRHHSTHRAHCRSLIFLYIAALRFSLFALTAAGIEDRGYNRQTICVNDYV